MFPISDARMLSALCLRSRVAVKRELQRLCRAHAATTAFLWTAGSKGDVQGRLEFAGDPAGLPMSSSLGGSSSFVCEQRTLRCADREEREVVVLYYRLATGAPTLVIGLVDSRSPFADVLTDDIEAAVERMESVIVDALEPADQPAARPAMVRHH